MAKTEPITLSELSAEWDKIDALHAAMLHEDEVPARAITLRQWAERYHISLTTADYQVRRLIERGLMKTGKSYRQISNRRTLVQCYWPAEEKPHAKRKAMV